MPQNFESGNLFHTLLISPYRQNGFATDNHLTQTLINKLQKRKKNKKTCRSIDLGALLDDSSSYMYDNWKILPK